MNKTKKLVIGLITLICMIGIVGLLSMWYPKLSFLLGFLVGITGVYSVCLIIYLIRAKKEIPNLYYDERQEKARGQCYKVAFFVLVLCLIIDGTIRMTFEYDWSNYLVGVFTCIGLSVGVFVILAILKNAYTTVGNMNLRIFFTFLAIGLLNIGISIGLWIQNGIINNGQITITFINFFTGIILTIISVVYLIKYYIDKKVVDNDE